jgi:hypothetical protein
VVTATPAGSAILADLHPEWERAQAAAARLLGEQGVAAVLALHDTVRQTTRSA